MRHSFLLLSFIFVLSPLSVFSQVEVEGAVLVSPAEYKLNESKFDEETKPDLSQATLYKEAAKSKAIVYRLGAEAPLSKTLSFVGHLYLSRSKNNTFYGSTKYSQTPHPDNYNETVTIVNPSKGIEGEFYHHEFEKTETSGEVSYKTQELHFGLAKKIRNGEIELTAGVNRTVQEMDYKTVTTEEITHYKTKTELKQYPDGIDYWLISNTVLGQEQVLGEKSESKKDTFIKPVIALQGVADLHRSRNGKFKIGVEAGVRYVVGDSFKPHVGFRASAKIQ